MKTFWTFALLLTVALQVQTSHVHAQTDTLEYDEIKNLFDGKLVALSRFPGEVDVVYNARFTPAEKCTLHTVLIGFSVVKFQPLSGDDQLIVYVYENSPVPPNLVNLQKTYRVNLGGNGFPEPNINLSNPLASGARDVMSVRLDPPVIFSPKREFIIGVTLESKQKYAVGDGVWNGFSILTMPNSAEYERYRRYSIAQEAAYSTNNPATQGGFVSMFMKAVVTYDPNLPDPVDVVGVSSVPVPEAVRLHANYPNPFNPSTAIAFSLSSPRHARLSVHDGLGREVAVLVDAQMAAGRHEVDFNAMSGETELPGGVYFIRLQTGGITRIGKMLLMK